MAGSVIEYISNYTPTSIAKGVLVVSTLNIKDSLILAILVGGYLVAFHYGFDLHSLDCLNTQPSNICLSSHVWSWGSQI